MSGADIAKKPSAKKAKNQKSDFFVEHLFYEGYFFSKIYAEAENSFYKERSRVHNRIALET